MQGLRFVPYRMLGVVRNWRAHIHLSFHPFGNEYFYSYVGFTHSLFFQHCFNSLWPGPSESLLLLYQKSVKVCEKECKTDTSSICITCSSVRVHEMHCCHV